MVIPFATSSQHILRELRTHDCRDSGQMVAAVLRGLRKHLQEDGQICVSNFESGYTGHDDIEFPEEDIEEFYDDISGALL